MSELNWNLQLCLRYISRSIKNKQIDKDKEEVKKLLEKLMIN